MDTIISREMPETSSEIKFNDRFRSELFEATRWAKFLSVMGFIFCGLIIVVGFFINVIYKSISHQYIFSKTPAGFLSAFLPILYIIIAGIYLFPFIYLYRFATKAQLGLEVNNQEEMNASIVQLKNLFRFIGIFLLIGVSIYGVALLAIVTGVILF